MNNKLYIKAIVAGVVILFFGASVALSGNENITIEKPNMPLGRVEFLLIPDSTADVVGMYDPYDGTYLGDLIIGAGLFSTPINAILVPDGNIYVSDQVADSVFVFDTAGNYLYTYADASDGLNNIRGIDSFGGHLFVTSGDDYVAEFDGPHSRLPDFINDGSDPFDILFLNDGSSLVADIQGSTDNVRLYNPDGTLNYEVFSVSFPEQIQVDSVLPGAYLNAAFSDGIITDFELDGTIIQTTPLSSGRGIYRLGNGNLLATDGNGVHEIEPGTGAIIETEHTGSARFIELYSDSGNQPPYVPSDPDPDDGATDVDLDADLSWTGGDPNGDPVTYDVYFGTTTPPPEVATGISDTTYDPGTLDYGTIYYWKIVSWDDQNAFTQGPIWEFTTVFAVPDLDCDGSLSWAEVTPGETVTGTFTVENIGDPTSLLDWEVESYPEWGTWTFDPESGTGLEEGDTVTIDVEVVAPDEPETEFSGEVVLVNSEDPDDTCIIDVSLATPVNQFQSSQQIPRFLQSIIERYPILRHLIGL